jgi:myo-inositol-1-phosphate synthase
MGMIGVWLIGAQGSLASTVVVGARAIARGLAGRGALVTELPEVAVLPLAGFDKLVFGGWDVAPTGLRARARAMAIEDRALPTDLVETLDAELEAAEKAVRPGFLEGAGPAVRAFAKQSFLPRHESLTRAAQRLGDDLDAFRRQHRLDTIVVVNLASTEPPITLGRDHQRLEDFRRLLQANRRARLTPSMLYAYAALERGYPYINFTPSLGIAPPALQELGQKHHVPFYGSDGKTGETLMKTVLAPLFRYRNLEVMSWEGFNILGGGDGRVLSDPRHKRSKVRSKGGVIASTLGYAPHVGVAIEYVPSLGNWKTAWDYIHFRGFLGTKMTAQFIWEGCDSILAAPLVLDLVRLTEFAHRKGEAGPMPHLACFFKDPLGVSVHAFADQVRMLFDYVERHARGGRPGGRRKRSR